MTFISWVAQNRLAEQRYASDAEYRKRAAGRPLRLNAQKFSDGELLTKLRSFGINLDRTTLGRLCDSALSAQEIAEPFLEQCAFKTTREELEGDWIWICLVSLWQRWFPDKPGFEMLDDKMHAGYERMQAKDELRACRLWLKAWNDVLCILDKANIKSIAALDEQFRGTYYLINWIQDLEKALWVAGLDDDQFLEARITLCEESLRRFATDDALMTENWRRALAESYFELGDTVKTDALYREWLNADPQWGWGWIGWSDCYRYGNPETQELQRADQLLLDGLAVTEVRDYRDIIERLADSYTDQGRKDEAKELRQQARERAPKIQSTSEAKPTGKVISQKTCITFPEEGLPLDELPNLQQVLRVSSAPITGRRKKVGRNDPCPCGSGKKFKKCCGG